MKILTTLVAVTVCSVLIGCGTEKESVSDEILPQSDPVTFTIEHYKEPCQIAPASDLCPLVTFEGDAAPKPLYDCLTGLEYRWGTRYTVRAQRRSVDTQGVSDPRCGAAYDVLEVLEEEVIDESFSVMISYFDLPERSGEGFTLMGQRRIEFQEDVLPIYRSLRALRPTPDISLRFEHGEDALRAVGIEAIQQNCEDEGLIELGLTCGCEDAVPVCAEVQDQSRPDDFTVGVYRCADGEDIGLGCE